MSAADNLLKKQQSIFCMSLSTICHILLKNELKLSFREYRVEMLGSNVLSSGFSHEIIWFDLSVCLSLPERYRNFICFKQLCGFSLTCFWFGVSIVGFNFCFVFSFSATLHYGTYLLTYFFLEWSRKQYRKGAIIYKLWQFIYPWMHIYSFWLTQKVFGGSREANTCVSVDLKPAGGQIMLHTWEFFIQVSLGVSGPKVEHFGITSTFLAMSFYTTEFPNF